MKRLALAELDSHEPDDVATMVWPDLGRLIKRLWLGLLSLPRTPRFVRAAMTELEHMRTLAELKDLEYRKDHLRKEINAAHREIMRLTGKEAMTRHKLRTM